MIDVGAAQDSGHSLPSLAATTGRDRGAPRMAPLPSACPLAQTPDAPCGLPALPAPSPPGGPPTAQRLPHSRRSAGASPATPPPATPNPTSVRRCAACQHSLLPAGATCRSPAPAASPTFNTVAHVRALVHSVWRVPAPMTHSVLKNTTLTRWRTVNVKRLLQAFPAMP
jgi:hypothetical protein